MKKRILAVLLVAGMVAGMLLGCSTGTEEKSGGEEKQETSSEKDGGYTIGCTVYYMTEFVTLMVEGMEQRADKLGCDLVMLDAQQDAQNQITQVENLIAQKVDVIIVAAVDSDAILPAMEMCEDAGIPLVGVNMLFNTEEPYHYVGPDDVLAGELEMQNAIDAIGGEGNIVILEGPIGQSAQIQRLEGNQNVLDKYKGKIEVLADQTANWSREEALTLVENWLESFSGQIDAIVAHNDEMALGAIQALEAAGLTDKIVVTGVDAILDGCNAVKDGTLLGTVYQDAELEGSEAVQKAYDVLEGKVTEKELSYIDMKWITKDNVDELLTTVYAK
ncbi:MAG: substrate-binding domain-containing protein [Ruminococcus sp.]|jgi:ribose transport system substrate-binding protein/inositol transport system substrate-binding protein|nr:substrate-binding domain-containing protein [Ruminococcus sp.]